MFNGIDDMTEDKDKTISIRNYMDNVINDILMKLKINFDEINTIYTLNFPFDVFQTIQSVDEDSWNIIGSEHYRTWTFMMMIAAISILLWILGRGIGEYFADKRINKLTKTPLPQFV